MIEKCKKHPRYQAKRQPTSDCLDCWHMWATKKTIDIASACMKNNHPGRLLACDKCVNDVGTVVMKWRQKALVPEYTKTTGIHRTRK